MTRADLVAAAFDLGAVTSTEPVARGATGQIWRLTTSTGTFAVKQFLWEVELSSAEAAAEVEVRYCEASGVRAPRSVRAADGRLVCEVAGAGVRVFSWVDGRTMTREHPGRATWVGETLGRLHAMEYPVGSAEVDPWFTQVRSDAEWSELAAAADRAGAPWAAALRDRLALFADLAAYVSEPDPATLILCHTDLQPSNVLADDAGTITVLDWDVGPQDSARSLARVLYDWHDAADERGVRETLAAYRSAGGVARVDDLRAFGDLVAGYLNYVAAQAGVALDERQPAPLRAHASGEVADLLANPLDLATCERLVRLGRG